MTEWRGLPTVEELRDAFSYTPETGEITRIWEPYRWGRRPGKTGGRLRYDGYRAFRYMQRFFSGQVLAWVLHYGEWPKGYVDHINGNTSDNRITNLRVCTMTENQHNRRPDKGRKYKGPTLNKGKWRCQIHLPGRPMQTHLGYFPTEEAAARAYDAAAKKHFGEFARLNFPHE
jgi:hypothetical protein